MKKQPLFTEMTELAIAVRDPEAAAAKFAAAFQGNPDPVTEHDEESIVIRQSGAWVDRFRFALITDLKEDGPIAKFLDRRGEGLYEICVRTSDLPEAIRHLKSCGFTFISEKPMVVKDYAFGDEIYSEVRYAFVHPASAFGVQIEVQQWIK